MADKGPNWEVEIKRLRVEVMQTELNIEKNELRVLDLEDEIRRVAENTEALKNALVEQREKLAGLEKTHGKEQAK